MLRLARVRTVVIVYCLLLYDAILADDVTDCGFNVACSVIVYHTRKQLYV